MPIIYLFAIISSISNLNDYLVYLDAIRFYCDIPDEFLFTNLATLTELALAIRNGTGTLTPEQKAQVESGPSDGTETAGQTGSSTLEVEAQGKGTKKGKGGKGKGGNQGKSTVIEQGNPLCPWFVCCY